MKSRILAVVIATALLASVFGPSFGGQVHAATRVQSHTASHVQFLDKTRFFLHVGVAYYAFHHFVYAPYKAHAFDKGAKGRTASFIKAGIALLFAYHEMKVAIGIANGSSSKTLKILVSPLNKLASLVTAAGNRLKKGQYNPSDISNLSTQTGVFSKLAGGVKDITAPIPGL